MEQCFGSGSYILDFHAHPEEGRVTFEVCGYTTPHIVPCGKETDFQYRAHFPLYLDGEVWHGPGSDWNLARTAEMICGEQTAWRTFSEGFGQAYAHDFNNDEGGEERRPSATLLVPELRNTYLYIELIYTTSRKCTYETIGRHTKGRYGARGLAEYKFGQARRRRDERLSNDQRPLYARYFPHIKSEYSLIGHVPSTKMDHVSSVEVYMI